MFERILVPLDGSALAECVLPHVIPLARIFHAHVLLVRVLEPPHDHGLAQAIDPVEWHMWKAESQKTLEQVRDRLAAAGVDVEAALLEGQAAQTICEFAHQRQASLIVLSSHGEGGLSDWNIGSVVQKLIVRAHTTLLIVPAYLAADIAGPETHYERLVVPLDGSQRAECALPIAVRIAEAHGARLLLAHVVRTPEMARHEPLTVEEQHLLQQVVARNQQAAADYLARMQAQLSIPTETRLVISKHVVPSLYAVLDDAHTDLVLLTAHGYSGHTAWPCGSVATSFIAHASFPLFIVQDVAHGEQPASAAELAAREHGGH
jgi:nucleotide-binding universal stress UspA family protein